MNMLDWTTLKEYSLYECISDVFNAMQCNARRKVNFPRIDRIGEPSFYNPVDLGDSGLDPNNLESRYPARDANLPEIQGQISPSNV